MHSKIVLEARHGPAVLSLAAPHACSVRERNDEAFLMQMMKDYCTQLEPTSSCGMCFMRMARQGLVVVRNAHRNPRGLALRGRLRAKLRSHQ